MGWNPQPQPQPAPSAADEGRGLEWFWARAEVGASYMHLSLDEKALDVPKPSSGGAVFGAAAGARLLFFTAGARFRWHQMADWNMWQLGGMLGLHIPSGMWDFGGDLYFGFAQVGNAAAPNPSGVHFGVEGGVDYYFVKWFSAGATIDFELLFLGRAAKNGVGLGTALVPHAAIHF
jgi:hypothetical protein